ncbi:MAG: hypothetical protein U0796_02955 [Gemmatales bacterium]
MARPKSKASKKSTPAVRKSKSAVKGKGKAKARTATRAKAPVPAAKTTSKPAKKKVIRYRNPLAKKLIPQKTIRFKKVRHPHDGQGITFRVPSSWKETWGSEDNALFYPLVPGMTGPTPVGGKLFVRFRLEPVGHANEAAAFALLLSHRTKPEQQVVELGDEVYLLHFTTNHNMEGFHAIDYLWFLAKPFPPRRVAVASFLFSGIAELFDGKNAPEAHVIEMLQKELPKAVFDREILPVERE